MAGEEFGVMLDLRRDAKFAPVSGDGAHTVWADGDDLLNACRFERFEARFGERLKDQVVAEAAGGVAGAFFSAQHAEGCAEMPHDAREVCNDLASARIVPAHAAQPEAR